MGDSKRSPRRLTGGRGARVDFSTLKNPGRQGAKPGWKEQAGGLRLEAESPLSEKAFTNLRHLLPEGTYRGQAA
jgi:hypothetical protein